MDGKSSSDMVGCPTSLMRSSGKYADLICEKLSEINYEDTHFL